MPTTPKLSMSYPLAPAATQRNRHDAKAKPSQDHRCRRTKRIARLWHAALDRRLTGVSGNAIASSLVSSSACALMADAGIELMASAAAGNRLSMRLSVECLLPWASL